MLKVWTISHKTQIGLLSLKQRPEKGRRAAFKLVKDGMYRRPQDAGCSRISRCIQVTGVSGSCHKEQIQSNQSPSCD